MRKVRAMTHPEGQPPQPEAAKKSRPSYRLSLARLECHDNEDSFGGDGTYISVNGNRIWQTPEDDSMSEGETAYLDHVEPYPFRGSAAVSLWDADTGGFGDSDPPAGQIGEFSINPVRWNLELGKEHSLEFTGDGASYTLYYSVEKA
jgi:hypothetical protein